jgi:O-antigen/teichoic acid export membrane protein
VFVVAFLAGLPLGLVSQVRAAFQEGFLQSSFAAAGNLLTIVLLLVATYLHATLPELVLALTIGPIVANGLNLFVLIRIQKRWLAPRASDVTRRVLRSVVTVGLAFLVLQVAYVVAFSLDRVIAAQVAGPIAAADYSVVARLFSIPAGLGIIMLEPLWPAYREAIATGDLPWIRRTLRRSIGLTLLATIPLAIVLTVAGPALVSIWTGHQLNPDVLLYPVFGAFTVVLGVATAFAMFLNGAQVMRFQIATWVAMGSINIALSVYLGFQIGVAGVVLASVITITALLIIPNVLYVPTVLRRLDNELASATRNAPFIPGAVPQNTMGD